MEENLKKYYKNVFICKKCNEQFGSDFRNDEASLCPLCLIERKKNKTWKKT